jgi:hypothetical protein
MDSDPGGPKTCGSGGSGFGSGSATLLSTMALTVCNCRKIEKYNHKVDILLNCLTKLDKVRVNISLLQVPVTFYSHCFIMPGSAFSVG